MEKTNNIQSANAAGQEQDKKVSSKQRQNQIIYVEYTESLPSGHFITVTDRYKNVLGRIYKNFNVEKRKFEYTAFDHENKQIFQPTDKLYELKNQFILDKNILLEKAHQRRIENKKKLFELNIKEPASKHPEKNIESSRTEELQEIREKSQERDQEISR